MIATATLKLIALVVPLALDTLGVALALGIAGLPARHRLRVALLFAFFEAAMPLAGVALGAPLGHAIGAAADYAAAALLLAIGLYMLMAGEKDERLLALTRGGVLGAAALGLSVSLDELAIGFSAGLLRLPVVTLVVAVAAQAFVLTQVGLLVGARAGGALSEASERVAGVALVGLAGVLLVERLS